MHAMLPTYALIDTKPRKKPGLPLQELGDQIKLPTKGVGLNIDNFNQRKLAPNEYELKAVTDFEKAQRVLQAEQEHAERKQ